MQLCQRSLSVLNRGDQGDTHYKQTLCNGFIRASVGKNALSIPLKHLTVSRVCHAQHLPKRCALPRGSESAVHWPRPRRRQCVAASRRLWRRCACCQMQSETHQDHSICQCPPAPPGIQRLEKERVREAKRAGAQLLAHAGKELFHVLNVRGPGCVVKLLEATLLLHEILLFSFIYAFASPKLSFTHKPCCSLSHFD